MIFLQEFALTGTWYSTKVNSNRHSHQKLEPIKRVTISSNLWTKPQNNLNSSRFKGGGVYNFVLKMCNHFEVNYQGEEFSKEKKFQMNFFSGLFFDGEIVREQIIVFIHEIIILLIYSQAIL